MTCGCHLPAPLPAEPAHFCFLVPADVVAQVLERGDAEDREAALRTLSTSSALRARRSVVAGVVRELNVQVSDLTFIAPVAAARLTVYDVAGAGNIGLPGERVRGEGDPPSPDESVNEAFDGADLTYRFFKDVFGRDSIDDRGLELVSSVHYGKDFDNAMWNGVQMIYGDGSGRIMARGSLTKAVDVIGHELSHGITQSTAGLRYRNQSGALNESFSDVFGSLVKQHANNQSAEEADWLIGAGILGSALKGQALRSMKDPGHAYDLDRQPGHMSDFVELPDDNDPRNDNGGVHINSGIPNRAFYLAATTLGGYAWEKAGRIWYSSLTERLHPESTFREAAEATVGAASELFGAGGAEEQAVRDAWRGVGVLDAAS